MELHGCATTLVCTHLCVTCIVYGPVCPTPIPMRPQQLPRISCSESCLEIERKDVSAAFVVITIACYARNTDAGETTLDLPEKHSCRRPGGDNERSRFDVRHLSWWRSKVDAICGGLQYHRSERLVLLSIRHHGLI